MGPVDGIRRVAAVFGRSCHDDMVMTVKQVVWKERQCRCGKDPKLERAEVTYRRERAKGFLIEEARPSFALSFFAKYVVSELFVKVSVGFCRFVGLLPFFG